MTKNLHQTYGAIFFISKSMVQAARAPAQMAVFEYMQAGYGCLVQTALFARTEWLVSSALFRFVDPVQSQRPWPCRAIDGLCGR
jgi:hypothetical protein